MPTPEEYDRSRNEIQQQIRDKLGMRVPGSQFKSSSMKGKMEDKEKPIDVQILEEIKSIKEILKQLLEK